MQDLTILCNDGFKVLAEIKDKEIYVNGEIYSKCSQEDIAEKTGISRNTVSNWIDYLISNGLLEHFSQKSKYLITKKGNEVLSEITFGRDKIKASRYKCISLFAGVGGIELGFENAGFKTIYANEFDSKEVHTFEKNFNLKVDCRDIHEVVDDLQNGKDFINDDFSILLAGFPCQAFSIAGYREGFDDKKGRGNLFFEIMKIVKVKQPEVIFLENVKNLAGHDNGKTFRIIREALESEGYTIKCDVLNSMDYGNVPQNRERIYIVAFKSSEKAGRFKFPLPQKLMTKLEDIIDYHTELDKKFYYTEDSFSHYNEMKDVITRRDTVYQWRRVYVRENKSNVCPTLTANMGTGGHNVPLVLTDNGIRKLTPRECFLLQGYPKDFVLPGDLPNSQLYKQAGNSVSVTVIERIAREILKVLD